ncbi:MAG: ribokinase [Brevinema sp.]
MKKVLVAGSLNIDLVVTVPRFNNPGETILGSSYMEHPGGKGANQASAVVLQNVPTTMWGRVGDDAHGMLITKKLKELNINSCLKISDSHTGLAFIEVAETGKNRIVVIGGANSSFVIDEFPYAEMLITEHDIILLQHEIPLDTNFKITKIARNQGKKILLNPAPAEKIPLEMLKLVDYLLPNEYELGLMSEMPTDTPEQIVEAMRFLQTKGCKNIITTAGIRGAFFLNGKDIIHIPAPKMNAIDTTGAGDSFCGAFAAYLARGFSDEESLKRAIWAASISVTRIGAFGSAGTFKEIEEALL